MIEWKCLFIEDNMPRIVYLASVRIQPNITFVCEIILEKNTFFRLELKFMCIIWSEEWKASITKDF